MAFWPVWCHVSNCSGKLRSLFPKNSQCTQTNTLLPRQDVELAGTRGSQFRLASSLDLSDFRSANGTDRTWSYVPKIRGTTQSSFVPDSQLSLNQWVIQQSVKPLNRCRERSGIRKKSFSVLVTCLMPRADGISGCYEAKHPQKEKRQYPEVQIRVLKFRPRNALEPFSVKKQPSFKFWLKCRQSQVCISVNEGSLTSLRFEKTTLKISRNLCTF